MIDIHSHIIPGVDDGAQSVEESLAMLDMAAEAGTTGIVATSHANQNYRFDPDVVKAHLQELQNLCGDRIHLYYGCELHLTIQNVDDALRFPNKYSINEAGYVLIEISDYGPPDMLNGIGASMRNAGIRPILAHPERNLILQRQPDRVGDLVDAGILMQVTAYTIARPARSVTDKTAQRIVASGWAHVAASDGHEPVNRRPTLNEAYRWTEANFDEETAELLFRINPARIIAGEDVEQPRHVVRHSGSGSHHRSIFGR